MLGWFPFMLFPVLAYSAVALFGFDMYATMNSAFELKMASGDIWKFSFGDGMITFSLLMLFIETLKSSGTDKRTLVNHALSMVVLVAALLEFILLKGFGTSVFFFITVMALFDTVGGPLISIVASRRDLAVGQDIGGLNPGG